MLKDSVPKLVCIRKAWILVWTIQKPLVRKLSQRIGYRTKMQERWTSFSCTLQWETEPNDISLLPFEKRDFANARYKVSALHLNLLEYSTIHHLVSEYGFQ